MTQEEFQRLAGEYLEQLGRREPDPPGARRPGPGPWSRDSLPAMSTERPLEAPVTRNQLVTVLSGCGVEVRRKNKRIKSTRCSLLERQYIRICRPGGASSAQYLFSGISPSSVPFSMARMTTS